MNNMKVRAESDQSISSKKHFEPRILISGAYETLNRGTMAYIIGMLKALNMVLSSSPKYILVSACRDIDAQRYKEVSKKYNMKVIGINSNYYNETRSLRGWIIYIIHLWLISLPYHMICDVIIDACGEVSSETGLAFQLVRIIPSIIMKKRIILYGYSMEPIQSRFLKLLLRAIYNKVDLITVRDEATRNDLLSLGIVKAPVHLTADHAFLLEIAPQKRLNEIMLKEGLFEHEAHLAGLAPNFEYVMIKGYVEMMVRIIDYLIERFNLIVVLIPHFTTLKGTDDRSLIRAIFQMITNKHKVRMLAEDYLPSELKGIIGACSLLISSRMHPSILSTSMYVPTILVMHRRKAFGFMRMLNLQEFTLNPEEIDFEELASKVDLCWYKKDEIKMMLKVKIRGIKRLAWLNAELLEKTGLD